MSGPRTTTITARDTLKKRWVNHNPITNPSTPPDIVNNQRVTYFNDLLISQGHKGFNNLRNIRGDIGGEFLTLTHTYTEGAGGNPHDIFYQGGNIWIATQQYAKAENIGNSSFPELLPIPVEELQAMGTNAISATIPTSPRVNGMAMVGELIVDEFPIFGALNHMRDEALRLRYNTSSDYLAQQFGWTPLINDLKKLHSTIEHQAQLISDYVNNSGVKVKRKLRFPTKTDSYIFEDRGYPSPAIGITRNPYAEVGYETVYSDWSTEYWFEGCYTYYVPPLKEGVRDMILRNEQLGNYLYGTRLTPTVLWQLAPWSWAVDWFSNTGNVIKNITEMNSNGLVLEYGYMMAHQKASVRYMLRQEYLDEDFVGPSWRGKTFDLYQEVTSDMKQRIPVGPYNWSVDWGGLNPFQLSIAAALFFQRGKYDSIS